MLFDLNIKNFGKLDDAKIRIGHFTVFAGPNNTGKSYVSKLLYSLFNAMNANLAAVWLDELAKPILRELRMTERILASSSDIFPSSHDIWQKQDHVQQMRNCVQQMQNCVQQIRSAIRDMKRIVAMHADDYESYEEISGTLGSRYPQLIEKSEELKKTCDIVEQEWEKILQLCEELDLDNITGRIKHLTLKREIDNLHESISSTEHRDFILSGLMHKTRQSLMMNFQTPDLSLLRNKQDKNAVIDIPGIGKFEIGEGGLISFSISMAGLQLLRAYSKVIYLESPLYWKLKDALESLMLNPRFSRSPREGRLTGVPGYFYELASALREKYTNGVAFPSLLEKLTREEVLNGKVGISEDGELVFQEKGKAFPLPLVAMGVANLGILALLIERKIIDEETFIFIDEPEAHLHPAWQVVMAETLFALSQRGVNVVIATHSVDILKWLEVHVKEKPEDEKLIALNHFTPQGVESRGEDFEADMRAIKKSLIRPFADLRLKGLTL